MELKELSDLWKNADVQHDDTAIINRRLVKGPGLGKIKSTLHEIKWSSIIEIIIELAFSIFLVNFCFNHSGQPRFIIPAGLLFGLTIYNLLFESYRLFLYYSINPDSPVFQTQKKLSRLKKLEIFDIYSLLIIIPVAALPFIIILAKALINQDLYRYGFDWMIGFSIGSIVIAAILVVVLRLFPNRKLKEAMAFIEELKE